MKKRISVIHVANGMYICGLDRPWTETGFKPPFELQGFHIQNDEEIDAVKAICRYVYIDPTQGADCRFEIPEDESTWDDDEPGNLLAADLPKLSLDNPTAKALQYVHESPDAAKLCSGCQLYTGSADAEWGPCAIFPGTVVAAGGWCVSWSAKA